MLTERQTISMMPSDEGFGAGSMHDGRMPDVWQRIGIHDGNEIAVYVTDAAVLTIARELMEKKTNGVLFVGHWMSPDQLKHSDRAAFYATGLDRP